MKYVFIFILPLMFLVDINAQGNLQFNQALLFSGTTVNTVPAGKVWKVESSGQSYNSSGSLVYSSLVINGQNWFAQGAGGSLPSGSIWLPAGATIAGWANNTQYNIIEFNVIP